MIFEHSDKVSEGSKILPKTFAYIFFQDAHNAILNYDDYSSLFAVYDGHGGHEVAIYTAKKLPNYIKSRKDYRMGNIEDGLINAFLEFDKTLTEREIVRELRVIAGKEADTGQWLRQHLNLMG